MTEKLTTRREIKEMPDQQTLEVFLEGLCGPARVYFNIEEGKFVWIDTRPDPMLGQPKTEEGRRCQQL